LGVYAPVGSQDVETNDFYREMQDAIQKVYKRILDYSMRHECKGRKPIFDGCISSEGEQTANNNGSTLKFLTI
jgi:hypothetical protein